jgi:tripartite-type tricarboxylate transporter receptor subunit TctC
LIYGSPDIGVVMHLAGEMLQHRTGIKLLHVPYKGGGPAVIDLVGGQVPVLIGENIARAGNTSAIARRQL